jgi:hypothetical protein
MVNLQDISSPPCKSSGYFLDLDPYLSITLMVIVAFRALGLEYLVKI